MATSKRILPTYHRSSLREAEHAAARLELSTGHPYVVVRVAPSRWCIKPGRLVQAMSEAMTEADHD